MTTEIFEAQFASIRDSQDWKFAKTMDLKHVEKYDYKVTGMVDMDAFKAAEDGVNKGKGMGDLKGKEFKKVIFERDDTMKEHR